MGGGARAGRSRRVEEPLDRGRAIGADVGIGMLWSTASELSALC